MRHLWAIVSDLHCGSTLGLCHPSGVQLDDGGQYLPSEAQRKLWDCWLDYWKTVKATLKKGDKLFVLLNGDVVDGDHHRTAQIVSKNLPATQHEIAMATMAPALALSPSSIVFVRGTEAHVGGSAAHEERLARDLEAVRDKATGAYSWWHFQTLSAGVLIDAAHHGRIGTRKWTKLTGLSTLVSEIMLEAASNFEKVPNLAIRSHYHQWGDTGNNYLCRLIQTGAWQLSTSFVHRIAAGKLPSIGGVIATCEDGRMQVELIKYPWKRNEPWVAGSK